MDKNMLRQALWEFLRPLIQLISNILNPDGGEEWLAELKKFLRKEPCWVAHPLLRLIATAKFKWVRPKITPENFPEEPIRSQDDKDYKVYHFESYFNRAISLECAIAEMIKDGYIPANIYELLYWKGWDRSQTIVAFGSSCVIYNHHHFPCRASFKLEPQLDLGSSFGADCGFLAVRNPAT